MNFPIRKIRPASVSFQPKVIDLAGRRPSVRTPSDRHLVCRWHRDARGELTCFWEAAEAANECTELPLALQA